MEKIARYAAVIAAGEWRPKPTTYCHPCIYPHSVGERQGVRRRRALTNVVVVPLYPAPPTGDKEQARYFLQLFEQLRVEKSDSLDVLHSSPFPSVARRLATKNQWRIERLEQELSQIQRILAALQDRWMS